MRRTAALIPSVLAVLALTVVTASSALAAPRSLARFELRGSHGYRAMVEAAGPRLRLTVERRRKPVITEVRYSARARTTPTTVESRLGRLGRIAVTFKPRREVKHVWPPHECNGPAVAGATGTFSGTIRFRGEDGFVELDAARAQGRAATSSRWTCGPHTGFLGQTASSSAAPGGEVEAAQPVYAVLAAAAPGRSFFALASHPDEAEIPFFSAVVSERREGMGILRFVATGGPTGAFVFDDGLHTATVQPPAPFTGSARFERAAGGSKTWQGPLGVSFPGRTDVRLAGARFQPALRHDIPGAD